jgi:hypothetical protein
VVGDEFGCGFRRSRGQRTHQCAVSQWLRCSGRRARWAVLSGGTVRIVRRSAGPSRGPSSMLMVSTQSASGRLALLGHCTGQRLVPLQDRDVVGLQFAGDQAGRLLGGVQRAQGSAPCRTPPARPAVRRRRSLRPACRDLPLDYPHAALGSRPGGAGCSAARRSSRSTGPGVCGASRNAARHESVDGKPLNSGCRDFAAGYRYVTAGVPGSVWRGGAVGPSTTARRSRTRQ